MVIIKNKEEMISFFGNISNRISNVMVVQSTDNNLIGYKLQMDISSVINNKVRLVREDDVKLIDVEVLKVYPGQFSILKNSNVTIKLAQT